MARTPGPAPSDPGARHRRNVDPVVNTHGWTELELVGFAGKVPAVPGWLSVSDNCMAIYSELGSLPQAALWGPGTWFELHMTLPLIDRYLSRPGSESFKAIIATLGVALRLTEDDLQKARVKVVPRESAETAEQATGTDGQVTDIRSRRSRLTKE